MYEKLIKRPMDVVLSALGLVLLLPVFLVVAVLVKVADGGPVFFLSKRLGRNGKMFGMFKFRTMIVNAPDLRNPDNTTYNAKDDPRVTVVGRYLRELSLDEIPQIINVLKGDMSLIGPRPGLPESLLLYDDLARQRLRVRPGITGLSQARLRNCGLLEERYRLDAYYVDHVSFVLDLRILIETVLKVVIRRNIYRENLSQLRT
jgi:undecaprenyl phosphate N,N'-diacetylbacillosamine 1-phosphate transferase